ncbi:sensor histidine kinase, partial [Klebsiella pneumoniae]|uniref:sensor histidine kinase n=1 Tax=Klebsiella pneumoniae TaxID=573 RepID=UPI003B983A5F
GMAVKNSVKLTLEADKDIRVDCDGDRIIQVLVNLISNAVKFSPPSGTVKSRAIEKDDWVEIRIEDEGRGIPKELQAA